MTTNILNRRNLLERRQQTDISLATQPQSDLATVANLNYDYGLIATEHRDAVRQAAVDTKTRLTRMRRDAVGIGKNLLGAKERLGHGQFTDWFNSEFRADFNLSERSAQYFMSIAQTFSDRPEKAELFSMDALKYLSGPQITSRQLDAAIAAGENADAPLGPTEVKRIVAENAPKRGPGAAKKPAPATIDGTVTRAEKPATGPSAHAFQSAEYIEAQLATALRVLPIYEQETGDTASTAELRKIIATMLENLGAK